MAGTRLVIQATFVLEFFLLVLAACYLGLYQTQDPITHHLPHYYQKGRPLIRQALKRLEATTQTQLTNSVAIIKIATPTADCAQAVAKAMALQLLAVDVVVDTDATECQGAAAGTGLDAAGAGGSQTKGYSIWMCPPATETKSQQQQQQQQVYVRNGITYIYPNNLQQVEALLRQVLASSPKTTTQKSNQRQGRRRKPLKISLMVEQQRKDWDAWAQALSSWMQRERATLEAWPCLRPGEIETEVVLSTLLEGSNTRNKTTTPANQENYMRLIEMADMKGSVIDRLTDNENYWNVIFYVPRQTPASFVDETGQQMSSKAMYVGNTLVTTIDQVEYLVETSTSTRQAEEEDENGTTATTVDDHSTQVPVPLESLVNDAMLPLSEFLLRQCLGVLPLNDEDDVLVDTDNTLPLWQLDAWLQRTLTETYEQARTESREEAEWLLESSTWVVIDAGVAAYWERLVDWIQEAYEKVATAGTHQGESEAGTTTTTLLYLEALALLENALEYVQVLRTDPTLMEPLRFSAPQFLAIFAPLCLPLFLPHFIGLLREWKRYKKLGDQKRNAKAKED